MAVSIAKQTKLWEVIESKLEHHDIANIEDACNQAEDLLARIPDTFPTYTLHDMRHSKNVCDIMSKLLGNRIYDLTGLEAAFLVLSAFYHDIGMVYTSEEKSLLLDSQDFLDFRKNHRYCNVKIKANNGQIPDDIAELFFRTIHSQRMGQVPKLYIGKEPIRQELVALCKSHGSTVKKILEYRELTSFSRVSADLVFCAVLLRLADILDFDQGRAPDILYNYLKLKDANTEKLKKSKCEFLKHEESLGFNFPNERPEGYKIYLDAQCDDIEIEHDIRSFLEVVNEELKECANLLSNYKTRMNHPILPASIDIKDSYGKNYQYGQYLFTVEQEKVLKLFTGENLYTDRTVFVRELLQNAIDTILHRQLYDRYHHNSSDSTDELAVRITTWVDSEQYLWIRVDDDGMGMDEERIRKYFLRAGESFYTSAEFIEEIEMYKEQKDVGSFTPISRFGIGVLSCFLAGDRAEVSTLAYDSKPVRLSMTAGKRYFITQLEEKGHKADVMPMRDGENPIGYRNRCGTSIAVRVAPYQQFVDFDFEKTIKKYVIYPPIPVYLNPESVQKIC